jgi:hypothetical protein
MVKDDRLVDIHERAEDYDFENCPTRLDRYGPYHKPDVAAAIYKTGGVYAHMAYLLGRRRNAIREYVIANPDLMDMVAEVRETAIDLVENNVLQQAVNGDAQQGRFILQTLGKDRGYSSRSETTGKDGGPIDMRHATIDPSKLDDDTIKKLLDARDASNSNA